jgi:16S rRNA (uracil1498-N3)-methyltransferase
VGDRIVLFDGSGGEHRARLAGIDKRSVTVVLEAFDPVEREPSVAVTLAQSVLAGDAMDHAVRRSVELGAAAIVPVIAARSQRLGDREARRQQHWQSIAIAACEQSGRNRVPRVAAPMALAEFVAQQPDTAAVAMAAPGGSMSLAAMCASSPPRALLIGPEGGFSDDEVAHARERGVAIVHLGPRVLRADTAALAGLATIAAIAGDAR